MRKEGLHDWNYPYKPGDMGETKRQQSLKADAYWQDTVKWRREKHDEEKEFANCKTKNFTWSLEEKDSDGEDEKEDEEEKWLNT